MQLGVHAGLSSRRPRVQIPSGPPTPPPFAGGRRRSLARGNGHGRIAQLVERTPEKREVTGSTPVPTTRFSLLFTAAPTLCWVIPHVVVIGAGFGGLRVARGLADSSVTVTLIDTNNFHTFQPLLYQVATSGLDVDDIGFPARAVFRKQRNASFRLGHVTTIDLAARTVTLADDTIISYDYLVIAAGTISATFGIEGVTENTLPLKTMTDATAMRRHLLHLVEDVARTGDVSKLSTVIVGGGPTGVEIAGGIRELFDNVVQRDLPTLDMSRATITLVEAADRVLATFHPKLSRRAERTLQRRGVTVEVGSGVERIEPDVVVLRDDRMLRAQTIIWAAGVTANPVSSLLGIELGRGGRIPVGDDLSLSGHPEVFAIGDIALSPTDDEKPLPQVAQPAIQGGVFVAAEIGRRLEGQPSARFVYRDKGSMATIGRNHAIAEFPSGLRLHSFVGWVAWLGLHIVYLMGFRNRANVLVNWAWNYLTFDRGSRLLITDQASAVNEDGQLGGSSRSR